MTTETATRNWLDETDFDFRADTIDVRDMIKRVEELEDRTDLEDYEQAERDVLASVLDDLKGYGGDEQWRGDWYPITLIRDSYFRDYAEELAEDIGAINREATWPNNCIDWERAANELQMDYSSVEIEGATYWYR